jgi:integrase
MASVNKDGKGRWRVQFKTRRRQTLRLGRDITERAANEIGRHIDQILDSRKHGTGIPADTAKWLERLPEDLRLQLVQMEVVNDTGATTVQTLEAFLTDYLKSRTDLEASTHGNLETAKRWLVKYFGVQRELASITPGEADTYRIWLGSTGKQAPNTVKRLCGRAKQFFRAALRRGIIAKNPFEDMKHLIVGASPKSRIWFVNSGVVARVLAACPNAHWRAVFALARYGGLRVPSELCLLRWQNIDWENGRLLVNCQKTKGHEGKELRITPLFPELRRELEAWRAVAPADREFVLKPAVSPKTNLRTGLIKILKKAGIKPWPKLYQNLRSSRVTELRNQGFRENIVAQWLGHSVRVADEHYDQVTEDQFRLAIAPRQEPPAHGAA